MYPKFFELLEYTLEIGFKVTIVTNGTRLEDEAFCKKLANYQIEHIAYSIHSHTEEKEQIITQRKFNVLEKKLK